MVLKAGTIGAEAAGLREGVAGAALRAGAEEAVAVGLPRGGEGAADADGSQPRPREMGLRATGSLPLL